MADSIREQIIDAIMSGLKDCKQSNGYNVDLGGNVKRGRISISDANFPTIAMFPGSEVSERRHGYLVNTMDLGIDGIADLKEWNDVFDENLEPSQLMELILADLIEVMTAPVFTLPFTSGGTFVPAVGHTLTGATSAATGYICGISVSSGTWTGGDAVGNFTIRRKSDDFETENLNIGSNSNIATTNGSISAENAVDRIGGGFVSDIIYSGGGPGEFPEDAIQLIGVRAEFQIVYEQMFGNPYSQP